MKEEFLEETVKLVNEKKEKTLYVTFNVISWVSFILAGVFFYINFFYFDCSTDRILTSFITLFASTILFMVSGIVCFIIKNKYANEYDYTFCSGQLSFSKVINSAKRYDIATIESYDIEKIGPINSQEYNKYLLNKENKFKILSSNKIAGGGKAFYYIVFNKNNEKFIYVLECTKEFILTLRKYLKSYSIDKEL